jgi:hypothetical protein
MEWPLLVDSVAKGESRIGPNFGETLKREAIDDPHDLTPATEVVGDYDNIDGSVADHLVRDADIFFLGVARFSKNFEFSRDSFRQHVST